MHELSTYCDEQLLRLLRKSNEQSFAEIYDRYWKPLYISAHNILQNQAASEDAVQEVFISLWNRRTGVQIESLKAYLTQAVRFQVFKAIRAEKADMNFFKRLTLTSKDILTQNPVLFKELKELIDKVIDSLPEDQKAIFNMSREREMTYNQIASEKNISVKTVEKKMSRALSSIRYNLDKAIGLVLFLHLL